ncbi:hypothetical protein FOFC_10911 [Fusarium oxysporum]|nr:hypothetical protein FOFC_10911 [Fusarium oxysporum]
MDITLALLILRKSFFDYINHIVAFCYIRLVGIGCLQASSDRHRYGAAVMLLAVAIRSIRIGSLTA